MENRHLKEGLTGGPRGPVGVQVGLTAPTWEPPTLHFGGLPYEESSHSGFSTDKHDLL